MGSTIDTDLAEYVINNGVTLAVNAGSIWYAYKAIRGRINATATIKKE
ncbi:hypothetical protein [Limnoglobus roseus]|nr:hypothetical protein [Limnoglobus roseus]